MTGPVALHPRTKKHHSTGPRIEVGALTSDKYETPRRDKTKKTKSEKKLFLQEKMFFF